MNGSARKTRPARNTSGCSTRRAPAAKATAGPNRRRVAAHSTAPAPRVAATASRRAATKSGPVRRISQPPGSRKPGNCGVRKSQYGS